MLLLAVALAAGLLDLSKLAIAEMLAAYLPVAVLEWALSRPRQAESAAADPMPAPESTTPPPAPAEGTARTDLDEALVESSAEPEWDDAARDEPLPRERPQAVAHEPVPEPDSDPEPVSEPEPEPAPEPEPEPQPVVVALPVSSQPRRWNVRELEGLSRDRAGADPVRDEEWSYLLVYLRDFASPEGGLSADFDSLERESFGELLAGAAH